MIRNIIPIIAIAILCTPAAMSQDILATITYASIQQDGSNETPIGFEEVPLEVKNGKLLIRAKVDGKEGFFILDTGAPSLIINQLPVYSVSDNAFSIDQSFAAEPFEVSEFEWAGNQFYGVQGYAIDLSHLEQSLDVPILGMVGHAILQNYEVYIDFKAERLFLRKAEDVLAVAGLSNHTITMQVEQGLPIVEGQIGGQRVRLIVDLGTAGNVMDRDLVKRGLNQHYTTTDLAKLRGLDQKTSMVESGQIESFAVGGLEVGPQPFLLTDLSQLRDVTGINISGILGYDFFKEYRCIIDYKRNLLHLWTP